MTVLTRPVAAVIAGTPPLRIIARVWFWRVAWWLCGGLTVRGTRPPGPAVVIANHSSHADSAALLAALPARQHVWFAAAADYWFCSRRKRALSVLVPTLPVDRAGSGAYFALRAAAAPVLAAGGIVVVYPEGTRGARDTQLGEFRAGAAHLARDLDVPLVPAAIAGTAAILPKGGRFHRAPAALTFGDPLACAKIPTDPKALRSLVADLVPTAVVGKPHPWFSAIARRLHGPRGAALAFFWGFAEALVWPLLAEMSLLLFAVTVPRKLMRQAAFLTLGSVAGVVTHAWLAAHGVTLPLLLTTPRMAGAAASELAAGPWGILNQAVSGIPVKVYAAQAGLAGVSLPMLALAALVERGARILTVGVGLLVAARLGRPLLQRYYSTYLLIASVIFVYALSRVIASWS